MSGRIGLDEDEWFRVRSWYREKVREMSTEQIRWELSCKVPEWERPILKAELAGREAGKGEG